VTWVVLRTVIEEPEVSEAADKFSADFARFGDAWDALRWLIAREPNQKNAARHVAGESGTEYMVYVQAGDVLANTPDIWILYTYTVDSVVILGINAVQPAPSDEL